jgi:hypothetical protein
MPKGSEQGVGMARSNRVGITNPPAAAHQLTSPADGEEIGGVGAKYFAEINERENKSNPRNMGPSRVGSFAGRSPLPVATKAKRHTGRVS